MTEAFEVANGPLFPELGDADIGIGDVLKVPPSGVVCPYCGRRALTLLVLYAANGPREGDTVGWSLGPCGCMVNATLFGYVMRWDKAGIMSARFQPVGTDMPSPAS